MGLFSTIRRLWRAIFARSAPELTAGGEAADTAAYREPAALSPELTSRRTRNVPPLWKFTFICHLCGKKEYESFWRGSRPSTINRTCGMPERVRVGLFRRCQRAGVHIHQRCLSCGASWIAALPEGAAASVEERFTLAEWLDQAPKD